MAFLSVVLIVVASGLVSLAATVLMRRFAPAILLTDQPDGRRKLHTKPIPLGGGLAILVSLASVLGVLWCLPGDWTEPLRRWGNDLVAMLLAATLIVALGLIDDLVSIRGLHKLFGQLMAASILIANGLVIERFSLLGCEVDLGVFAIPFTLFWFFGAINAVNLLDGIDGLATMLGVILTATIAVMAALVGRADVALPAWVFFGALLGFWAFNFPPASIFLGDAGSMLIGLLVGAMAIQGSLKGPGTVLLIAPLVLLTIPILDSAAALLRRRLTGRSIYTSDRGHLHHRLLERFGTNRRVLLVVGVGCIATSLGVLASLILRFEAIALLAAVGVVGLFVGAGWFGREEFHLCLVEARKFARRVVGRRNGHAVTALESTVRLQGCGEWDALWDLLLESTKKLSLQSIRLDVNMPLMHEGFAATWESHVGEEEDRCWNLTVPLIAADQQVGRLEIAGGRSIRSSLHDIEQLLILIEPVELKLRSIIAQASCQSAAAERVGAASRRRAMKQRHVLVGVERAASAKCLPEGRR